ncbi:MAG TPA: hypothetical protein VFC50_00575 [Candidatus Dormibacteraeota bacterium]|nr:hypothetical protein [Candidatus Dormibacteraeota bacterium]
MYSIIFHAHQKLDRAAHRHLLGLLPDKSSFPAISQVLNFEGPQGPDGAKLKRLKNGQPWHFVDPLDANDTDLHGQISMHYKGLVQALKQGDDVRAAFEASWMAHALVDGLTPAHHFPYEAELSRLRGGEERHTRKGLAGRLYVKGDTLGKSVLQSLKLVGPKGLLTTHAAFEAGAYAIIAPLRFNKALPSRSDIESIKAEGVIYVFRKMAREVAELNLYERFYELGWTRKLSRDVRRELAPRMVRMITLAWYSACHEAGLEVA